MELGVPLVLAFNMSDMVKARGHEFDIDMLSRFFGAPIVQTIENDREVWAKTDSPKLEAVVEKSASRIEKITGEHPETAIAGRRYGFISGACQEAVRSTIEIRHTASDRIDAVVTNRLLSCGARLPIYVLIVPAFFPQAWQGRMLWIIYMIGIVLAILLAKLLRISLLNGESVPFVIELPPYRMPTVKGIFIHMWERARLFLKKAGTVILAVSVLLWAATAFPGLPESVKARFENKINNVQVSSMTKKIKTERIAAFSFEPASGTIAIIPLFGRQIRIFIVHRIDCRIRSHDPFIPAAVVHVNMIPAHQVSVEERQGRAPAGTAVKDRYLGSRDPVGRPHVFHFRETSERDVPAVDKIVHIRFPQPGIRLSRTA